MPRAPKDPIKAKLQQEIMAGQPTYDGLIAKDPTTLTDAEILAMVEHLRRERALWDYRTTKAQERKAVREGAHLDEDPDDEDD